jgi:energy-converting hydrogenase Eha subunit C
MSSALLVVVGTALISGGIRRVILRNALVDKIAYVAALGGPKDPKRGEKFFDSCFSLLWYLLIASIGVLTQLLPHWDYWHTNGYYDRVILTTDYQDRWVPGFLLNVAIGYYLDEVMVSVSRYSFFSHSLSMSAMTDSEERRGFEQISLSYSLTTL